MSNMKRKGLLLHLTALIGLVAIGLWDVALSDQGPEKWPEEKTIETVAPGVEHIFVRRGDFGEAEGSNRWQIHILTLEPRLVRLELAVAMDEIVGAETTSSMASRRGALAAVNGGYFRTTGIYRGEPAGLLVLKGTILSEPDAGRSSLAVSNAEGRIRVAAARSAFSAELIVGLHASRPISGFNRPRGQDELIVFLPEFHRSTLTAPDGLEAIIERGRVTLVKDGTGSAPIPRDGFVLSASGTARDWAAENVREGASVEIKTDLRSDPPFSFEPEFIVGAGPRLVRGGEIVAGEEEIFPEGFYGQRHPRTAIGVKADLTIVLMTVDGRQPKTSVGMSIPELAALMTELGCVEAINLDGGGSTTMVVRDKVVNNPSDPAGERPVSDALVVLPRIR
ncbi:MAG: phosphodiester glycosidase family protein [Candidatus Aminicenantes bacterium]|nr:phosphodiester glycosidase family protein [Candidatus Aminicenantes bacterium]